MSNLQRFKARLPSRFSPMTLLLLGVVVVGVLVLAIIFIPQWQARDISNPKDHAIIENAARLTLVQAFGGLFVFVTAYVSFQNLVATQEKQVTERFAKAIELLGNENIHVRLGGIYALERISKDSDKDYWQVMEILTAYVRERSPYPPKNKAISLTTDIQAILTVISRRGKSYGQGEENRLDLSKSNLYEANLERVNLEQANLEGVNLEEANLDRAVLRGAILMEANLKNANLEEANLEEALLVEANLENAILGGAILRRAVLREVKLGEANLSSANLEEANLEGANLYKAILTGTNLMETYLAGVILVDTYNLTPEQVKQAQNWEKATYDDEFRALLGLPPEQA